MVLSFITYNSHSTSINATDFQITALKTVHTITLFRADFKGIIEIKIDVRKSEAKHLFLITYR